MSQTRPDDSSPEASQPRIMVYTLGGLEITVDGQPLRFSGRAPVKPLALLAALIACGNRGVSIERLADQLWPDADGDNAYRAFTTTLYRLRRVLGCAEALRISAGRLFLDTRVCRVDLWELEHCLHSASDVCAVIRALSLYRGPFLMDDSNPWCTSTRTRVEKLIADARRRWGCSPLLPIRDLS